MTRTCSVSQLQHALNSTTPPLVIDVRRRPAYEDSTEIIDGAIWLDPEQLDDWSSRLDKARPVVVYCVHGHQVSQGCATSLGDRGYDVSFLQGGIEEWKAAEGRISVKSASVDESPTRPAGR
jgi:rhodanese-related sulfurtransferase